MKWLVKVQSANVGCCTCMQLRVSEHNQADLIIHTTASCIKLACSVDISRAVWLTGTKVPTNARVIRGVATTAARVDTVVIATLNGTSAFARNVTTFEATPPGHAATMHILQQSCKLQHDLWERNHPVFSKAACAVQMAVGYSALHEQAPGQIVNRNISAHCLARRPACCIHTAAGSSMQKPALYIRTP